MPEIELTASLEDYLETILQLTKDSPVARVRDIAAARDVKPGSVTPAMKRLESMRLIEYAPNDYICLTDTGRRAARRVLARHHILTRFFAKVLQMSPEAAENDACAMEHHMSDEAMDRLARFFEFMAGCPEAPKDFLERFHNCCLIDGSKPEACANSSDCGCEVLTSTGEPTMSTCDLKPGQVGQVIQINASPVIRQRLLDMGILPNVRIQVERTTLTGDPIWLRVQEYQVSLRREEAECVMVKLAS